MSYSASKNLFCKHMFTRLNKAKDLPPSTSSSIAGPQLFVSTAAVLLITASAGFGALFAWRTGSKHDLLLGVLSVAMALGLEISKPFAIAGAFTSLREWRIVQALALALTGALAVGYSLQAELTFMAMTRGDLVAERAGDANTAKKAEERYRRAADELATLEPARPANAVGAEIDGLLLTPGVNGCLVIDGPKTSSVCPRVAILRTELARAQRRSQLEGAMQQAEQERQAVPVVAAADPGATALATYAESLGVNADPAKLGLWLPLIGVLALEIGAAFSVLLMRASGQRWDATSAVNVGVPASQQPAATANPGTPEKPAKAQRRDKDPPAGGTGGTGGGVRKRGLAAMLESMTPNGAIEGSQRQLARALGKSKSSLHRMLHELAEAGTLVLDTSRAGTRLALV